MFHNLKGYDSHLVIKEIRKIDVKVSVAPKGLEKCMAFTINKYLVFIDSMQFMNSSLDALVTNLSNNDFISLPEEFSSDLIKLVKQNRVYPYEYMNSLEKISEDKLPDKCKSFK